MAQGLLPRGEATGSPPRPTPAPTDGGLAAGSSCSATGGNPRALPIIDIFAEITTSATGRLNARKYRVLILSPRSGSA